MRKNGVVILLLSLFLIQGVHAEITVSEMLDVYNLGDKLYVSVGGLRGTETGNLNIDLACKNTTINLVRISSRAFSTEEDQRYAIPYKLLDEEDLEIENLTSIIGTCQILSTLGSSAAESKEFSVTKDIRVSGRTNKANYDPGETVTLTIEATKANGKLLEGFIEISNASNIERAIVAGTAKETITTTDTVEAGTYTYTIKAYDTNTQGKILNEGGTTVTYTINQVPSFIKMSLSDEQATPGEPFSIGVEAFDQSGIAMPGSIALRLTSPEEEATEMTIGGGEFKEITLPTNASAGIWKLQAQFQGVTDEREIEVPLIQKVAFEFEEESILVVKNIGNTLYNETILFRIGAEERELNLRIEKGGERRFEMSAPTGEHEVTVSSGDYEIKQQRFITGNAVAVKDLATGNWTALWIFITVLIILAITYYIFRRTRKRNEHTQNHLGTITDKVGSVKQKVANKIPQKIKTGAAESIAFTKKSPEVHSLDTSKSSSEDASMVDMTKKKAGIAESSPTLKGEKYPSAVLALHIQNYKTLNEHGHTELKKIVEEASGSKGLIDAREEYLFILYSPLITKTYNNELLAVRAAKKINETIQAHNKKFTSKFEYNIGIHCGDLVANRTGGKVKYTSMGNTISLAKRLADTKTKKILVSEEIRKKLLRDVKVEKEGTIGEKQIYSIQEIKDKEANEAKLKDLLKRM